MSLFSARFTRPGPGVSKDEPDSPAIARFFQILGRKFSKLVQLNLLFLIPAIITAALCIVLLVVPGIPRIGLELNLSANEPFVLNLYEMYVVPLPLILLYPFTAGLTYVTRNFVREEHAFVFSDAVEQIKRNFKQFFLKRGYFVSVLCDFLIRSDLLFTNIGQLVFVHSSRAVHAVFPHYDLCPCGYMPVMLVTFGTHIKAGL